MAAVAEIRVADLPEVKAAMKQAERRIKAGDALADEVALFVEHGESGPTELKRALARYRKAAQG